MQVIVARTFDDPTCPAFIVAAFLLIVGGILCVFALAVQANVARDVFVIVLCDLAKGGRHVCAIPRGFHQVGQCWILVEVPLVIPLARLAPTIVGLQTRQALAAGGGHKRVAVVARH
jgi:hypothetical protein